MSIFDIPPPHDNIWVYPEILRRMLYLQRRGLCDWKIYGKSTLGRNLWYTIIGSGDRKVMLCARQHGTEYTSTHSLIHMMNTMVKEPGRWSEVLSSLKICIVPVYNVDGAIYYDWIRRHGNSLHYKIMGMVNLTTGRTINRINGDPNRDHEKQKFPETRAFNRLMLDFKPEVFLDLHNFGFATNLFTVKRKLQKRSCVCPLVQNNADPEFRHLILESLKIAHILQRGIRNGGLTPAKVNEIYPAMLNMDSVLRKIGCAPNYYLQKHRIPGITVETMGDFGMGDIFIHQSVPATILGIREVLDAMVSGEL